MVRILAQAKANSNWNTTFVCQNYKCRAKLLVEASDLHIRKTHWWERVFGFTEESLHAMFMCPVCHKWQDLHDWYIQQLGLPVAWSILHKQDVERERNMRLYGGGLG